MLSSSLTKRTEETSALCSPSIAISTRSGVATAAAVNVVPRSIPS
jgi:hypothetical protein